jgi:hypothetical protein|tara:strand:+ start:3993 stop:4166 length:174 start_codon:yes stop_codon:yes gene_type:complete
MTAKDSLLTMYKAEIDCLRSAYLKEKDNSEKLCEIISDKEIIIKLLKNKNKAYDKFN